MAHFFETNYAAALGFFLSFAILVGAFATVMTKFAVGIKDRANLPDGVVGGILIGIITSIPETITTLIGVANGSQASAVLGDVIGSDMFCVFVLSICLLATVFIFRKREVNQGNTITTLFIILGCGFCLLAGLFDNNGALYGVGGSAGKSSPLVWHGFNLFSIFILLSYVGAVLFMIFGSRVKPAAQVLKGVPVKTRMKVSEQKPSSFAKYQMWILIVGLIASAALLTAASIVLASSCEALISSHWGMSAGFGRAFLLGIATSLPELVAVINLAINKRYNMMIDSMVGSCCFNMSILFIANCVYAGIWQAAWLYNPESAMFVLDSGTLIMIVMFLQELIFLIAYLIINSKSIKSTLNTKQTLGINSALLGLVAAIYIVYVIMGFLFK